MLDKIMNKNINVDKEDFTVSCYEVSLPFEWYSMEYILKELENSKVYFGNMVKMEKATKANPDLLFDSKNGEEDNRYAGIFLENLSDAKWSETIVIVNHESSASEEADNQAALFIECYLQRKFNLLDS